MVSVQGRVATVPAGAGSQQPHPSNVALQYRRPATQHGERHGDRHLVLHAQSIIMITIIIMMMMMMTTMMMMMVR